MSDHFDNCYVSARLLVALFLAQMTLRMPPDRAEAELAVNTIAALYARTGAST